MTAIKRLFTGGLIVGAGDGTVEIVEEVKYENKKTYATNLGLKAPTVPALRVVGIQHQFLGDYILN